MSFLVDGELISRNKTTVTVFGRPRRGSLDIHRHLPDPWVGLAASLRSMPTALCFQVIQTLSAEADKLGKLNPYQ